MRQPDVPGGITSHAESLETTAPSDKARLFDASATNLVRHFSALIWLEATGHRPPNGSLGTFPQDEDGEDEDY